MMYVQVRSMVGGKRMIDVMNCATQQNSEMTMKEWEEFFIDPNRLVTLPFFCSILY